jgi:SAM-dependent methyltransferase
MSDVDALLAEQVRYYRERAPEYDATSQPEGDPFAAVAALAHAELRSLGPVRRAIELGAGTGQFTELVAAIADEVEAVDTSPEVLELNGAKLRAPHVRYTVADVFSWRPAEPADLVVAAALLSHIPRERFGAFWASVGAMLRADGRFFLFDEAPHGAWSEEATATPEVVMRTLNDGRRFRIVKILWDADELTAVLRDLGWTARLTRRDPFIWGMIARA